MNNINCDLSTQELYFNFMENNNKLEHHFALDLLNKFIDKNNDKKIKSYKFRIKNFKCNEVYFYIECVDNHFISVITDVNFNNKIINIYILDPYGGDYYKNLFTQGNTIGKYYLELYQNCKRNQIDFHFNVIKCYTQPDDFSCGYRCLYIFYYLLTHKNFNLIEFNNYDTWGVEYLSFFDIIKKSFNEYLWSKNNFNMDKIREETKKNESIEKIIKELFQ